MLQRLIDGGCMRGSSITTSGSFGSFSWNHRGRECIVCDEDCVQLPFRLATVMRSFDAVRG